MSPSTKLRRFHGYFRSRLMELSRPETRATGEPLARWAQRRVRLDGKPFRFDGHAYLQSIYDDTAPHVVLSKAAQIGGTTWGILRSLHACVVGLNVIYFFPTRTDVLARVENTNGHTQTVRLTPSQPEFRVSGTVGPAAVLRTYFKLGVEHILLGFDHLLFVLALLFLVEGWRRLVATITAFTIAHSLTLAAATFGWVQLPQAPVEAVIALSIMFIAVEILHRRQGKSGIASRKPWVVAFVFGLLHGLGFAGALRDVGLPEHAVPLALAFFNLGIEAGQLLFVAAVFLLFLLVSKMVGKYGAKGDSWSLSGGSVARPASYLIGTLAAFWLIERTYGFFT